MAENSIDVRVALLEQKLKNLKESHDRLRDNIYSNGLQGKVDEVKEELKKDCKDLDMRLQSAERCIDKITLKVSLILGGIVLVSNWFFTWYFKG